MRLAHESAPRTPRTLLFSLFAALWLAAVPDLSTALAADPPAAPPEGAAPAAPAADPYVVFKPLDPPPAGTSRETIEAKWTSKLGESYGTLARVFAAYEAEPNIVNALTALKQFKILAKDADLRKRAIDTNTPLFLTLDALKYELALQSTLRLNDARRRLGKPLIAFSYRVGSSGARFRAWLAWAKAGKILADMPIDDAYKLAKLFYSDDDITNRASPEALAADPLVNERINGARAALALALVSQEWGVRVEAEDLKVEFLSPTKAYQVIRRKEPGYEEKWPNYLGAWIVGNEEKYRGLFAEEQLHAWGKDAGHVTDLRQVGGSREIGVIDGATTDYAKSALMDIGGQELFPKGVEDVGGWMANNYRQIFEVHKGEVLDLAKYTLRMMEFWKNVKQDPNAALTAADVGMDPARFAELNRLSDAIRNAKDDAALAREIGTDEKKAAALDTLVKGNWDLLRGGHRQHVSMLTEALKGALVDHGEPSPDRPPPTVDGLMAEGTPLRRTMETLATAYSNLPDHVIDRLNRDNAVFIRDNLDTDAPDAVYGADVRLMLMDFIQRAQTAGSRLRSEGEGFRAINAIVESLRGGVNEHLKIISKGVDLDGYVEQVIAGEMKQRRLKLEWDEKTTTRTGLDGESLESTQSAPRVRWVDEQWDPVDVALDLKRLQSLSRLFNWSTEDYARNLYEYFTVDGNEGWPKLTIQALRHMADVWDPTRAKARYAEIMDHNGETKRLVVEPTTRGDAALNLGVVGFKVMIKGGKAAQQGWKVWGDITDARDLGKSMVTIFAGPADLSSQQLIQDHAMALSKVIALSEYAEYINAAAKQPALFANFGGTIATGASLLGKPLDGDGVEALGLAALKDAILLAQPELALPFAMYDIYNWSSTKLTHSWGNSALVNLLVKNGTWEKGGDTGLPVLTKLNVNNLLMDVPNAEARKQACDSGESLNGIMELARLAPPAWANGIDVVKDPGAGKVKPRESLFDVYYGEDFDGKDPVLAQVLKGVRTLKRIGITRNTRNWTTEWLNGIGVTVPTPEDARQIASGETTFDSRATTATQVSGNPGEVPLTIGIPSPLQGLSEGEGKMFGQLISMYWTRRQMILECQVMDKIIEEAARKKKDDEIATADLGDVAAEVAALRERMKDVDQKVWAEVARSADPFPGDGYDPDTDLPISADYEDFTRHIHAYLDDVIAYAQSPDTAKNPLYVHFYEKRSPGPTTPTPDRLGDLLLSHTRDKLAELLKIVREYEASYVAYVSDGSLNILGAEDPKAVLELVDKVHGDTISLRGAGFGFGVKPVHLVLDPKIPYDDWMRPRGYPDDAVPGPPGAADAQSMRPPLGTKDRGLAAKWTETYAEAFDEARQDMGAVIEKLQKTLRPLNEDFHLAVAGDKVASWWNWWVRSGPYDIGQKHPLWPNLLRLKLQVRKLKHILPVADQASADELDTAVGQMVMDDQGTVAALDGTGAAAVSALIKKMEQAYADTLTLAENMMELKVEVTPDAVRVTESVQFDALAAPRAGMDAPPPVDQVMQYVRFFHWELVPVGPPDGPEPDKDCLYGTGDVFWRTADTKPHATPRPDQVTLWAKRFLRSGRYAVRVTALSADNVPLARSQVVTDLMVEPARLKGELEVTGAWRPGTDTIHVVMTNGTVTGEQPRFMLRDQGAFDKPLCAFYRAEIPEDLDKAPDPAGGGGGTDAGAGAGGPQGFPPNPYTAKAGVQVTERSGTRGMNFTTRLDPESAPRPVDHVGQGVFQVNGRLKVHFPREVTVTVEVTDASTAILPNPEVTLTAGGKSFTGTGPHTVELAKGDTISAKAKVVVGDTTLERDSRVITYDPEKTEKALTLNIGMPFFDTGNLRLNGALVAPDPTTQVVGGEMAISITDGPETIPGNGVFDVANSHPVLLSDPVIVTGVMWDSQDNLLQPKGGSYTAKLKTGTAIQDIGPIALERHEIRVEPVTVRVVDWVGQEPVGQTVTVKEDANPDARAFGAAGRLFQGGLLFRKRTDSKIIKAEMAMPKGKPADGKIRLSLDDFGSILEPKPPATPFEVKLKVYLPGNLRVVGVVEYTPAPGAPPVPGNLTLEVTEGEQGLTNTWNASVGQKFLIDLGNPVRVIYPVIVEAKATEQGITYSGRASGSAPVKVTGRPNILDLGTIHLRGGVAMVQVPELTGMTPQAARGVLNGKLTLNVSTELEQAPDKDKAGLIHRQNPGPTGRGAATLPQGAAVYVWAYAPWHLSTVPKVTGDKVAAAVGKIEAVDLTATKNELGPAPKNKTPFIVVEQAPGDGVELEKKQPVVIGYYTDPLVPDVKTQPIAEAQGVIGARFSPVPSSLGPAPQGEKHHVVINQVPVGGTPLEPGGRVKLFYYDEPQRAVADNQGGAGTGPQPDGAPSPWAGPWQGLLRIKEIKLGGSTFTNYESLARFMQSKMKRKDEVEEGEGSRSVVGAMGEAVTAGPSAILEALFIGIQTGISLGYTGVEVSFGLIQEPDGSFLPYVPGMTAEEIDKGRESMKKNKVKFFLTQKDERTLGLHQVVPSDNAIKPEIHIDFRSAPDFASGEVRIMISGEYKTSKVPPMPGHIIADMTVRPGSLTKEQIQAKVAPRFKTRSEAIKALWEPYIY